jgi:muramoyltetrapeptide carboxypeptidase
MKQDRREFLRTAGVAGLGLPLLAMSPATEGARVLAIPRIKPPALKYGDTIAITSPAGAVWDSKQVELFCSILHKLGFQTKRGQTLTARYGYFAGTDSLRANELNNFFSDDGVQAIFCMKGGWGCGRILPLLDYENIRDHPKILMGFSDITSLLIAIFAKTGLVGFHGPVGNSGWNDFTTDYMKRVLVKKEEVVYLSTGKEEDKTVLLCGGKAKGILIGGNLSVIAGMMGSDYLPLWKDKILFLEETGEEPYRIDRMLTQMKLCGVLDQISGFVFGKCVKCLAEEPDKAFTFQQVLEQQISPLKIPAFYGAMIGHIENKFTIPVGIEAEMDADKGLLKLLEPAVV